MASCVACPPASALVALNDGRDRIYVNGSVTVGHDSNIFASASGAGDYVYTTEISADYTRRAGWIGVNGRVGVTGSKFATIEGQDFANPSMSLEFTKQTGRTTGSVTLNAARESRADASVNLRTESWTYNAGLVFRYPVSGTFTVSGDMGYNNTVYSGASASMFSDLATYHAGLDLFHIFTSDRDLIGGYRYRHGETSRATAYSDHSFTAGVSGRIIRGVKGSMRVGYQFRIPHGVASEQFSSWTASGSATYAFSKKMNVTASISKDFLTTAMESFVDTLTASLDGQYAYSSRWSATAGITFGDSQFLGENGRLIVAVGPPPIFGPERHDSYLSWNAAINYSMNDHLKVSVAYNWLRNWSTTSFADFVRTGYSLNVSSRW